MTELSFCTISDRRVAYRRSGRGETALLVHGITTLILRGDADIFLSAEICERLHRDISGSRLERIETGGHFVQFDEPEWVTDHLVRFMEASP